MNMQIHGMRLLATFLTAFCSDGTIGLLKTGSLGGPAVDMEMLLLLKEVVLP